MVPGPDGIDPRLRDALLRVARETGKSEAQLLSEALAAFLCAHPPIGRRPGENFYEQAQRLGLLGCIEGGPADLSTNKDYMTGFGEA
jgi:hypothetical protein